MKAKQFFLSLAILFMVCNAQAAGMTGRDIMQKGTVQMATHAMPRLR